MGELLQSKSAAAAKGGCRVLLFLDKRFEISNLSLIKNMVKLVELAEVVTDFLP